MRMVVISFIVFLLIIFTWIWFHFTSIELVTTYFGENLIELSNAVDVDDWDKAEKDMILYTEKWEDARKLWIYFLNQKDINNIDASFRKLEVYLRNFDKTMAQAELEQLRVLFNVIKEQECLSLDNIF
jgi:hypothetical protein